MDLKNSVFYNYDINCLKIFYTILRFINMDKELKTEGDIFNPNGYYTCSLSINELARAIGFKSRHTDRLNDLGIRAKKIFEEGIGIKGDKPDEHGMCDYETIHPIFKHSYKNKMFTVQIPVNVVEGMHTFLIVEKSEELLKLDTKISFRLYQLLFSNINQGTYTVHLDHFQKLLNTNYENNDISRKVKEAIKEINEKTDISIKIDEIKPIYKEVRSREVLSSLKFTFERKTTDVEPVKELNSLLEKTIEKTMNNRFFSDKYKKNPAQNLSVIYKLSKEFGEEIIVKALTSVGRDLAVEIKASLQAYMTKACHNEAENVKICEAEKEEKLAKQQTKIEKEDEKKKADEVTKSIDEQLTATYEKMSENDKKQLEEEARKYFLIQCEADKFNPILEGIFEKNKRAYIISVLRGS